MKTVKIPASVQEVLEITGDTLEERAKKPAKLPKGAKRPLPMKKPKPGIATANEYEALLNLIDVVAGDFEDSAMRLRKVYDAIENGDKKKALAYFRSVSFELDEDAVADIKTDMKMFLKS